MGINHIRYFGLNCSLQENFHQRMSLELTRHREKQASEEMTNKKKKTREETLGRIDPRCSV